jgi:hypothetical protein
MTRIERMLGHTALGVRWSLRSRRTNGQCRGRRSCIRQIRVIPLVSLFLMPAPERPQSQLR